MAFTFHKVRASSRKFSRKFFHSYTVPGTEPFCDNISAITPTVDSLADELAQFELLNAKVDTPTYASFLQQCAVTSALQLGRTLHILLTKRGHDVNIFFQNHLIHMYGKCNSWYDARLLFINMSERNVFSWNIVIGLQAQDLHQGKSCAIQDMLQMLMEGVPPDKFTFVTVLSCICSPISSLFGKRLHAVLVAIGLELDLVVGTALITMYSKCANLFEALSLFDRMPARNVVTWSAMIGAYAQHDQGEDALELFTQMEMQGLAPRVLTLVSCLSACATVASQAVGYDIHTRATSYGYETNAVLETALVDMYGKCGSLRHAVATFDKMAERNVLSWTAMTAAYAIHGKSEQVLSVFWQMQVEGMMPDKVSFVCVLSACSHLGLPEESYHLFGSMSHKYHIKPALEHFNSLIDLLGRLGRLDEGEILINNMPCQSNASSWLSLLAACRLHFDAERAQRLSDCVKILDPANAASFLLLSNICCQIED